MFTLGLLFINVNCSTDWRLLSGLCVVFPAMLALWLLRVPKSPVFLVYQVFIRLPLMFILMCSVRFKQCSLSPGQAGGSPGSPPVLPRPGGQGAGRDGEDQAGGGRK